MKFDVYCDESRPDLLGSKCPSGQYMLIGSLWLPREDRETLKNEIHALRSRYKIGGEFKWQKVSPSRQDFYMELVKWFHEQGERLRFRCIVVDKNQVDLKLYHEDDQELGFYKFYYQLLHHWILDCNEYAFFADFKCSRRRDRLRVLQRCLGLANLSSTVTTVQAIRSEESVLIQLTDVLTGMAGHRLNGPVRFDSAKTKVLEHFEKSLGRKVCATTKGEPKFNVFRINLSGGW